ncbi:MAG: hypothetical protein Q9226_001626 [Calogaya cf. arnoldii]
MNIIPRLSAYRPLLRHIQTINPATIRQLSTARAKFVDPSITHGAQERELDISIGSPSSSYVIVEPGVGSKLVGKQFADGEKAEVPLKFFHKTRHFAKNLASKVSDGTSSPAILFRYGVNSELTIKGSKDGTFCTSTPLFDDTR